MNEEFDTELVADFARLIKRHGADSFERLADLLREPKVVSRIIEILDSSASIKRRAIDAGRSNSRQRVRDTSGLRQLRQMIEEMDAEKSNILSATLTNLLSKQFLPSLRAVRSFARDNGLPDVRADSREKAIVPLVRNLLVRPTNEIKTMIDRATSDETPGRDRSLEGWTEVILNRSRGRGQV